MDKNNIFQRLSDFYLRSADKSLALSPIWTTIENIYHRKLIDALKSGSGILVRNELVDMAKADRTVTHGIEQPFLYDWSHPSIVIKLQRLAQLMGLLCFDNPEQNSPTNNSMVVDVDVLRRDIEAKLGFPFSVPSCFGFASEEGGDGITSRYITYSAAVFDLTRRLGAFPKSVLEIGAGLGNLGIISHHLSADIYTVIDLPQVAVLSAYFISRLVGEDRVWLYGEPENDSAFAFFYPHTHCDDAIDCRYDLIFNSDSIPEMTKETQDEYISMFHCCLSPEGLFVSINHESNAHGQSRTLDAVERHGGFRLVSRYPFVIRDGYVVEIYQLG